MANGFKVEIWGDYALFSRPELKVERVSYDVITPSAARGVLEAVYWKPAIRYVIDEIAVCTPIRFENIRRNEVSSKASIGKAYIAASSTAERAQRASMVLKNVRYIVTFHFEMTDKAGERDNEGKFTDNIRRRLAKGQHYYMPYLGTREFPANIRLILPGETPPAHIVENRSFGLMFHDFDYKTETKKDGSIAVKEFVPVYFRAEMVNGIIDLREVKLLR